MKSTSMFSSLLRNLKTTQGLSERPLPQETTTSSPILSKIILNQEKLGYRYLSFDFHNPSLWERQLGYQQTLTISAYAVSNFYNDAVSGCTTCSSATGIHHDRQWPYSPSRNGDYFGS